MVTTKNTQSWVPNAALSIASVAVFLALVEIGVRVVFFQMKAPQTFAISYLVDRLGYYVRLRTDSESGVQLNRRAWEASYTERGLPVPPSGPREGYWGSKVRPKNVRCGYLRFCEPERTLPGLLEIDVSGFQHVEPYKKAEFKILILGGSVAFGAYASDIKHTYFSQLVALLERSGLPAEVFVLAAGAWVSNDELTALSDRGLDVHPDVVVFLNGHNDVIEGHRHEAEKLATAGYLRNMRAARFLARERHIKIVYALQPFLPSKRNRSPLEERIMDIMKLDELRDEYGQVREGLRALAEEEDTYFIDASGILDGEVATTFADQAHFSDPAHTRLAETLANGLAPVLERMRGSRLTISP